MGFISKLVLAMTATVASTTVHGATEMFGAGSKGDLVKIDVTTGRLVEEAPVLPEELQGQQLSTIDKSRGIFYIVGFNQTSAKPNLVGWDLKTHKRTVDVELPMQESVFVGVGQAVDADPVTGDVFVIGRSARVLPNSSTHEMLRFHHNSSFTTSEHIVSLKGIDILDGSSAFDSKDGVEYVAMIASGTPPKVEFNIFAVDVAKKTVKTIDQDPTHGKFIQNLDYDETTGRMYGFGVDSATEKKSLVYLDTKTNTFKEVADVPSKFFLQEGNLAALDGTNRLYYALLGEGQPNVTTWKHSSKCVGCKDSSSEQCCYDPAQGPDSYTCFAVSNCSQITDGGGGPDLHQPIHLVGLHLDSGAVVSKTPAVCAIITNGTLPACPWSLESLS